MHLARVVAKLRPSEDDTGARKPSGIPKKSPVRGGALCSGPGRLSSAFVAVTSSAQAPAKREIVNSPERPSVEIRALVFAAGSVLLLLVVVVVVVSGCLPPGPGANGLVRRDCRPGLSAMLQWFKSPVRGSRLVEVFSSDIWLMLHYRHNISPFLHLPPPPSRTHYPDSHGRGPGPQEEAL
ncbi:unnamed protein product [Lota lota]